MACDKKEYYDVPEYKVMIDLQEYMAMRDLQQRKLYISENIYEESIGEYVQHILQYNTEDKGIPVEERKPILVYVSSNGGSVDVGFELIDVIQSSITPVYTINLGYQYSMGFLIGIAGHKRFAMPNAKYLIHDGSTFIWDSGAKAQDQVKFQMKVDERIRQYILDQTNITKKEYDQNFRVEWYMLADEAKEKGITDYIIGVDCNIEEII